MELVWYTTISDHMYKSTCRIFGERVPEFWTMSYRFFINNGPNNYLKLIESDKCRKKWAQGVLSPLKIDKILGRTFIFDRKRLIEKMTLKYFSLRKKWKVCKSGFNIIWPHFTHFWEFSKITENRFIAKSYFSKI